MKNFSKSFFLVFALLSAIIVGTAFTVSAKGKKEPVPFTRDTVFMTKNVVMYAEGDTLKYVTKQLTKIQIKNGVITANGNVLANSKAVMSGTRIKVSWINKNGFRIVYTGSPTRKVKSATAKAKQKADKEEKEDEQKESSLTSK